MRPTCLSVLLVPIVLAAVLAACTSGGSASTATPATTPPALATTKVDGTATAGPVCPVQRPGDPACEPRPVTGATVIVTAIGGAEVGRATTGPDGSFELALPAGDYVLIPQPVDGLMGTAKSIPFSVGAAGAPTPAPLQVEYDTGIR
jgi:hypothetical protein